MPLLSQPGDHDAANDCAQAGIDRHPGLKLGNRHLEAEHGFTPSLVALLLPAVIALLISLVGSLYSDVEARPVDAMYTAYWQDMLRLDPERAVQLGDRSGLDQFNRMLESSWREDMLRILGSYQQEINAIDSSGVSAANRRSLAILSDQIAADQAYYAGSTFETERLLPIDQFQGLHLVYAQDAAGAGSVPFKSVEDYDLALHRGDAYAAWTNQAIARLREGLAKNVVLPRLVVERVLPQLAVHLKANPEETEFWQPVQHMPADFSLRERERIQQAYRLKIATVIQPAYRNLHDFLAREYLPHTRDSVGLSGTPGGADLYQRKVAFHTTTSLTAAEIHSIGLVEVERISREIDQVQQTVGFKGTRQEFFHAIRANPDLHFSSPQDVIPAYQAAAERILPGLPTLFGVLPKAPYEIRPLPADSSGAFQGNGDYAAPAADGSRPGILWMNIYASGVKDRYNVMTISLHEGRPGHHFQASIALEQPDLPAFRRSGNYTAFIEGWGLYAESLGLEMNLFDDPWQYFGHLNYAILRANRLVIDTGLHAYGWSVEDGVQWMTEHSSMTAEQARAEVERYVAYPGQALAYKVGELKIRSLRSRAEQQLGERFDVRRFHDRVLRSGPVPLTDLEADILRYITEERATPE